ncbi:hypothetical protein B0T10DRAFT_522706, partial [Thelonectria olida]
MQGVWHCAADRSFPSYPPLPQSNANATIKSFVQTFDHLPLIQDPDEIYKTVRPLPGATPIPFLDVFYDGISCELCEDETNRYICRGRTAIEDHRKKAHGEAPRQPGRKCSGSIGGIEGLVHAGLVRIQVPCQTLFRNSRCRYYMVDSRRGGHQSDTIRGMPYQEDNKASHGPICPSSGLRELIDLELARQGGEERVDASQEASVISLISPDVRHQSQWLQMAEWPRFLEPHKHELCHVAALICLPDLSIPHTQNITSNSDALLPILLGSLDRVIARARRSLKQGRLNIFDQHRLNSFIAGRSSQKPIIHNLREETYRKYGRVLQHLVCYVFRLAWQKTGPRLHYRLTDGQAIAMMEVVHIASELAQSNGDGLGLDQTEDLRKRLDDKCLVFMVTLLDHRLYGDIYDSIVVGFLAALGIRPHLLSGTEQKLYDAAD